MAEILIGTDWLGYGSARVESVIERVEVQPAESAKLAAARDNNTGLIVRLFFLQIIGWSCVGWKYVSSHRSYMDCILIRPIILLYLNHITYVFSTLTLTLSFITHLRLLAE